MSKKLYHKHTNKVYDMLYYMIRLIRPAHNVHTHIYIHDFSTRLHLSVADHHLQDGKQTSGT